MIELNNKIQVQYSIEFVYHRTEDKLFHGDFLQTLLVSKDKDQAKILVGLGKREELNLHGVKEAAGKAAKLIKEYKISEIVIDISKITKVFGVKAIRYITEGLMLGLYEIKSYKSSKHNKDINIYLQGINSKQLEEADKYLTEGINLSKAIIFARDTVNSPGNKMRPMEFARQIKELMKGLDVETEHLVSGQLKDLNMNALVSVGESSEFPPCLITLRYMGNPNSDEVIGLVGKGVTCDTGGYCLKPAEYMLGIKGDVAGGAAVAGTIYALAKNKIRTNVVGVIPICENRISSGSLLPGDVISTMSGKTIEVINTDAEGRLILADAVSYAVNNEKVTKVIDIATLTGAVVNMLGFSTAGVLTNNNDLWEDFKKAYKESGERYWRLPIYPEHEKMIESKIADIKNQGESHCGTITAGLFIKAFTEDKPWLHIDIAGTAWVDNPVFEYQSKGATGAGVTTLYQLCANQK